MNGRIEASEQMPEQMPDRVVLTGAALKNMHPAQYLTFTKTLVRMGFEVEAVVNAEPSSEGGQPDADALGLDEFVSNWAWGSGAKRSWGSLFRRACDDPSFPLQPDNDTPRTLLRGSIDEAIQILEDEGKKDTGFTVALRGIASARGEVEAT